MTGLVDIAVVVLIVGGAAAWLGWHFFAPGQTSGSCSSGCGKCAEATGEREPPPATPDRGSGTLHLVSSSPTRPGRGPQAGGRLE
jgi:hypothetical protein